MHNKQPHTGKFMSTDVEQLEEQVQSSIAAEALGAAQKLAQLATDGNVEAAKALTEVYSDGTILINADPIKEFQYAQMGANLGSSQCRFWVAHLQHQSGDHAGAIKNATLAMQAGDTDGTTLLGQMMLVGEGGPAQPLEALQILLESAEKDNNLKAALIVAEAYLDGKYFSPNPQRAYDVLQKMGRVFSVLRDSGPQYYASNLYLRAKAIKDGAKPVAPDNYYDLIHQAAEAGSDAALVVLDDVKTGAKKSDQEKEWAQFAKFQAFREKWKIFYKIGVLVSTKTEKSTSINGVNGNIYSSTVHWQVATFEMDSGFQFIAVANAKTRLFSGRKYAVLFVMPANEETGKPSIIFDLVDLKIKKNDDALKLYPEIASKLFLGLSNLLLAAAVVSLLWEFITFASSGTLTFSGILIMISACAVAYRLRKQHYGGARQAIAAACGFFRKHKDKL